MKLINLEDLMKFPIRLDHYDKEHGNENYVYGVEAVLEYAQHLPIIDADPVKHGRWIYSDTIGGMRYYRCTNCSEQERDCIVNENEIKWYNFCPNCGAKMMDEKSDTDEIKYPHKKTINGIEITEYSEEAYEDDVGGFHDCAEGWNPNGVWCGECCALSCRGCVNENLTKENS